MLLTSCSLFQTSKSDEGLNCKKYKKFIAEEWKFDEEEKIFKISPESFDDLLKHKTCLYGLTEEEVSTFLGKPSLRVYGGMKYYMDIRCNDKPQKVCTILQVRLNMDNNLVDDIRPSSYKVQY